jgi:retron-type reverse transcriptase
MRGTPRPDTVFTKRRRIAKLARNCFDLAFTNLVHHIDIEWLTMAYAQTRKDGAVGVDGRTAEDYEVNLEANLQNLLDRAKSGTDVPPPVRRVRIPMAGSPNETRPLGIPTFEDTILQRAVLMVLILFVILMFILLLRLLRIEPPFPAVLHSVDRTCGGETHSIS